jgi:hypothetical protein
MKWVLISLLPFWVVDAGRDQISAPGFEAIPAGAATCTGAFVLAEAGLLDGRRTTTYWQRARELQARFPRAKVEEDRIFIIDGPVYHRRAGGQSQFSALLELEPKSDRIQGALAYAKKNLQSKSASVQPRVPRQTTNFLATARARSAPRSFSIMTSARSIPAVIPAEVQT